MEMKIANSDKSKHYEMNLRAELTILILVNIIVFEHKIFSKELRIKLLMLYCRSNETLITIPMCNLKPISRVESQLNLEYLVKHDIPNVFVNFQLLKQDTTTYKPFLVNVTLDLCSLLTKRLSNFYGSYALSELRNYTNLNFSKGCPIPAVRISQASLHLLFCIFSQELYYIKNWSVHPRLFKNLPIPEGNYKVVIDHYTTKNVGKKTDYAMGTDLFASVEYK